MPLRKSHRKSRRGCIECKRRHTKCDEHRPRCATCTRLVIPCTWPKPRTEATSSTRLSEGSTPGVISNFINISTSLQHYGTTPEHLAVGDLRLLHHFTTKTYTTIDTVVSQQHIWRDSVVQIGFRHPYLLRGVLAISALHLATLNPDLAVDFLVQASAQYNCALLDFRHTLQDVNDENCVAVFAFSCITVIHAFAVAQIHKPVNPIEDLVNCMRLVQGVGAILRPHWETLKATELGPLLENSPKGGIQGEVPEVLQLKSLVSLQPNYDEGATAVTCLHAIDLLHTVLIECEPRAENQPYMAFLFTWPALLSPEFFSSLSEHEPVSIIILAHFAAMLGQKGSCWWIACWNTYILRSVETILSTDLLKWLSWPKKIMGISDTDEIY